MMASLGGRQWSGNAFAWGLEGEKTSGMGTCSGGRAQWVAAARSHNGRLPLPLPGPGPGPRPVDGRACALSWPWP